MVGLLGRPTWRRLVRANESHSLVGHIPDSCSPVRCLSDWPGPRPRAGVKARGRSAGLQRQVSVSSFAQSDNHKKPPTTCYELAAALSGRDYSGANRDGHDTHRDAWMSSAAAAARDTWLLVVVSWPSLLNCKWQRQHVVDLASEIIRDLAIDKRRSVGC